MIGNTALFKFFSVPLKYAGWGGFKVEMDAGLKVLSLYLVFMLWTEELNIKVSKLDERNRIRDRIYWEVMVSIFNSRNSFLHEALNDDPVMILSILFCCRSTLLLSTETPPKIIPYSITE